MSWNKLAVFIGTLVLLSTPVMAQQGGTPRARTHRPPQTRQYNNHYPHSGSSYHYRTPYYNRNYYNHYPGYHYGYPSYRYPHYGYPYSGGYVYGGVVGTYGSWGFVYNSYRYVPPPVYVNPPVQYPAQQEVVIIAEGTVLVVGDKVITNQNGRIVVYKAAPAQQ